MQSKKDIIKIRSSTVSYTHLDVYKRQEYTNVKLSKAEYNKLYSEALTWDSDKFGKVCHKYLNNVHYYYTLDNDYNLTVIKMKKSENIHERKEMFIRDSENVFGPGSKGKDIYSI